MLISFIYLFINLLDIKLNLLFPVGGIDVLYLFFVFSILYQLYVSHNLMKQLCHMLKIKQKIRRNSLFKITSE
jgi:hypothetical protein